MRGSSHTSVDSLLSMICFLFEPHSDNPISQALGLAWSFTQYRRKILIRTDPRRGSRSDFEGINYAAFHKTEFSLLDSGKNRLFVSGHYESSHAPAAQQMPIGDYGHNCSAGNFRNVLRWSESVEKAGTGTNSQVSRQRRVRREIDGSYVLWAFWTR